VEAVVEPLLFEVPAKVGTDQVIHQCPVGPAAARPPQTKSSTSVASYPSQGRASLPSAPPAAANSRSTPCGLGDAGAPAGAEGAGAPKGRGKAADGPVPQPASTLAVPSPVTVRPNASVISTVMV